MKVRQEDIQKLKDFYHIRGDGVARLNIEKAVKSAEFQDSLKRLADYAPEPASNANGHSLTTP
ncbi:MAG: hypothetical protein RQ732_02105 [Methylophaga sp.]|nr:hypothetical protein [Methylophaga sp.]